MRAETQREHPTLTGLRRLLLTLLLIGMVGTAVDLLLLKHYEDLWQIPPLLLLGTGFPIVAIAWSGGPRILLILRLWMMLFVLAGIAGVVLHYVGNLEFQKEIDPTQHGWALFVTIIRAKAPPALAPAALIQLGLLGLLYTYRHPALSASGGRP